MLALANTSNYVLRMTDSAECAFSHLNMSKSIAFQTVKRQCKEREREIKKRMRQQKCDRQIVRKYKKMFSSTA